MIQIQLMNNVIEWEKALQFEEERRENHGCEPYVNYLAAPNPAGKNESQPLLGFLSCTEKTNLLQIMALSINIETYLSDIGQAKRIK